MATEKDAKTGKAKLRARDPADARRSPDERGEALDRRRRSRDASHAGRRNQLLCFNRPRDFWGRSTSTGPRASTTPRNRSSSSTKPSRAAANLIAGANKEDYHVKNITPGETFQPTAYADLRSVTAGEDCPNCGAPLRIDTAVEIGHIFKLGYKYSESMGARVLDRNGKEVTPIMGSYGIGIERILTAIVEQNNDENGFWLPPQVAPFEDRRGSHQRSPTTRSAPPPKTSPTDSKAPDSTCYWTTGTNGQG